MVKKRVKEFSLILIIAIGVILNLNFISSQGTCYSTPFYSDPTCDPDMGDCPFSCPASTDNCEECYSPLTTKVGMGCSCSCVWDNNECYTPGGEGCSTGCRVIDNIYYSYYLDPFDNLCRANTEICTSAMARLCSDAIFNNKCDPDLECVAETRFAGTSFTWEDKTTHGQEGSPKVMGNECSDEYDNDCDGATDCEDRGACSTSDDYCCDNNIKDTYEDGIDCGGDCGVQDNDNDKYNVSNNRCGADDCNDQVASVYPGAVEICDDNYDNNCDGLLNCADPSCVSHPSCVGCTDQDGDGYNMSGGTCGLVDCVDNPTGESGCPALPSGCDSSKTTCAICINPGAAENSVSIFTSCGDGVDNDCDTLSGGGVDWDTQIWTNDAPTGLLKTTKGDNGCVVGIDFVSISAGGIFGNTTPLENDEIFLISQISDSIGVQLRGVNSIEFYVENEKCPITAWYSYASVVYANCSSGAAGTKDVFARVNTLKSFAVPGAGEQSLPITVLARPGEPPDNPPWCVTQNIDRCRDYNASSCVHDQCKVGDASKPSGLVCGTSLCDIEDKWNNCMGCTWNGSECSYGWNKVNCTSGASSSGWCSVANEEILKTCNEEPIGEMTVSWQGTWMNPSAGDDPNDVTLCQQGETVTMACPESGNLPFFGFFQFMLSFFVIGIVYFFMRKK